MNYLVYEYTVENKARVHEATCSYVKLHGGVSRRDPSTVQWHEGFETVEAALRKARTTGREVSLCGKCKPSIAK